MASTPTHVLLIAEESNSSLVNCSPASPIVVTTIHSFSNEIVLRILELGPEGNRRASFLRATSRVLPRWRSISQMLLWRKVEVVDEVTAELFLENKAFGRYQTRELSLKGDGYRRVELSLTSIRRLLDTVPGLRSLSLSRFEGHSNLPLSIFDTPNLADLKSLTLHSTFLCHALPDESPPQPPPFSLHHLELSSYYSSHPKPHSFFSSPKLTSLLASEPPDDPSRQEFLTFFTLHANHLIHFNGAWNSDTLPSFNLCTNLTRLEIYCTERRIISILQNIPSKLLELAISLGIGTVVATLKSVIDLPSLEKLEVLRLPNLDSRKVMELPQAAELIVRFQKRGVEVRSTWD